MVTKQGKHRSIMRRAFGVMIALTLTIFGTAGYFNRLAPNSIMTDTADGNDNGVFNINSIPVSVNYDGADTAALKLFGLFTIKNAQATQIERPELTVGGYPFGIKLLTDGVIVTGLTDFNGVAPAKNAGVRTGDILVSINGKKVLTNREVAAAVQSDEQSTSLNIKRDGKEMTITTTPIKDSDGVYKIGIWVRDSSAGIGTITFYDEKSKVFGGLGHGVTDADTGKIMPLLSGDAVRVSIGSVVKSANGVPGELNGNFLSSEPIGDIAQNTECGIFGQMSGDNGKVFPDPLILPMAFKQEVHLGSAKIRVTTDGETPREYTVEIEKINFDDSTKVKNMVIRVTDRKLLAQTGGIVQGMSGSPIIQDGRLIGAVTHVFVGDTERGYGIFAENMYRAGIYGS